MEIHGTRDAPISMTQAVPWNSMELRMRQFRWHEQFHGIPWNYECANFDVMSSSMEFHGIPWNFGCANFADTNSSIKIPWNLECANFADTSSSMEFHGTWSAPISLTWEVPWNSMEFNGTFVRQFRWHEQFHGIPWNLECANFADTSSSMEFHGTWSVPISLTWEVPWNSNFDDTSSSMEHHGTWNTQISMTRAVPWNSMELGVRQFPWQEKFHGIPWN